MNGAFQLFFLIVTLKSIFADEQYTVNRNRFPKDFLFGVGTSSYQIEGGWNEDGKAVHLWENYIHNKPSFVIDGSNGDIACDSYHKLETDVAMLKALGVQHYRFSLAWTRILPTGFNDYVNPLGVQYYKKLIQLLKKNKIIPVVTLFHWDFPQSLQDLGGFLNESAADWFADYSRVCFKEFGDDVKYWSTFNEPKSFCFAGYGAGYYPPQIKSEGILDLVCSHNLLRAHAKAYRIYDQEFRATQRGKVSIVVDTVWCEPATNSTEDKIASDTALHYELGWYANPVIWGDYPEIMKTRIGNRSLAEGRNQSRLPEFTEEEKAALKGSADYFSLNTYTGALIKAMPDPPVTDPPTHFGDRGVIPIQPASWENSTLSWLKVAPWGMRSLLNWIKDHYNNPDILVTENGYTDEGGLDDPKRVSYHERYLSYIRDAMIKDDVKVIGYTAWSFMDNFEWASGYTQKFGLYAVDFNNVNRTRTPKLSARFYEQVCRTRCLVDKDKCIDKSTPAKKCKRRRFNWR